MNTPFIYYRLKGCNDYSRVPISGKVIKAGELKKLIIEKLHFHLIKGYQDLKMVESYGQRGTNVTTLTMFIQYSE